MLDARLGDLWVGACAVHGPMAGPIVLGSPNVSNNAIPFSRLTDLVIGFCGHPGAIVTGSPNRNHNGLSSARTTDLVAGVVNGAIVQGSPNTMTN